MRFLKRIFLSIAFLLLCFFINPVSAEQNDTTLVGGRTTYQIRFSDPNVTWNYKSVTFETVAAETYTGTAITNPSYDVSDTGMTLVTEVANLKYNGNGAFDVFPKQGGALTVKVTVKDNIFDGAIKDGHEVIAKYTQNFKITINPYLTYDIRYVSSSGKVLNTTTNKEVYNNTKYWTPTEINGYTSPSGKNIVYDNLNKQTIDFVYNLVDYGISYTLDGGALTGQKTNYNTEESYTLPSPEKRGYTFAGWTGANGTTPQTNVTIPLGSTGNKNYVANWMPLQYTIKYIANGGSGSMSNTVVNYDAPCTISASAYSKRGYTFAGWTTKSNGTDDGYGWTNWSGAWRYINGQYGIVNNTLTLYARWNLTTFSITYNLNGGSISGQKTSYTVNDGSFTLPRPTRSGYIFTGWTGSNGSTKQATVTFNPATANLGNLSYTANWAPVPATKTYGYNGGTQTYSVTAPGTYKLEVWGAQGGSVWDGDGSSGTNKGGYAYGNIYLNEGQTLYIVVGSGGCGAGSDGNGSVCGGYNGGGTGWRKFSASGHRQAAGGGGGATHIATTNRGVLSNYGSYQGEVLIVAGGSAGGRLARYDTDSFSVLGAGGSGGSGSGGGCSFGNGCNGSTGDDWANSGGGGGWSGGSVNRGGTNYIKSGMTNISNQSNKRSGDGYARISYVG